MSRIQTSCPVTNVRGQYICSFIRLTKGPVTERGARQS
jgi:hypothetical protein